MGLPRGHFFRQCRHQASTACGEFPFPEHQLRVSYCYEEGLQITICSRCLEHPRNPKKFGKAGRSLNKIQKALGEYLERERSSFPRFYFVGDEDLLEIIGNSKDILRIMKHLKKMFAGISTVTLDEDLTQIQGMASREGEEVPFTDPILLKDFPKINDWLAKIESMMRLSLANLLMDAVTELQTFYGKGADTARRSTRSMDGEISCTTCHPCHSSCLDFVSGGISRGL
jgi:hypothetical protein